MEQKPKYLVYERREILVFVFLGMMVALFSFTLGVHMGKRLNLSEAGPEPKTQAVGVAPEAEHQADELQLQYQSANQAVEGLLKEALKEEVDSTGIKLDKPIQIDLPDTKKGPGVARAAPLASGSFSVQVGSYPTADEAQNQLKALGAQGIQAIVREVHLSNKGTRYRVLIGTFSTEKAAAEAGQYLQAQKKISAFIVSKIKE